MNEEYLNSCSYRDLRRMAQEYDVLKSLKSKKKEALIVKLLQVSSKDPESPSESNRRETFLISKAKENIPDGLNFLASSDALDPVNKSGQRQKKRNLISKEHSEALLDFPVLETSNNDRRETFLVLKKKSDTAEDLNNLSNEGVKQKKTTKNRRGRKNKVEEILADVSKTNGSHDFPALDTSENTNRRETFLVFKDNTKNLENLPSGEAVQKEKPKKRRGRKNKDQEILTDSSKTDNSYDLRGMDTSENGDRRETFLVLKRNSDVTEDANNLSNEEVKQKKTTRKRRGRKNKAEEILTALPEADKKHDLPVVEDTLKTTHNRRETFTLSDDKEIEGIEAQQKRSRVLSPMKAYAGPTPSTPTENNAIIETDLSGRDMISMSGGRKRKHSDTENSVDPTMEQTSAPKIVKKAKIVASVTPIMAIKSKVNFKTPVNERKSANRTLTKSTVPLTPHPVKSSVTTPQSVKKTPGLFSAKKMPDFSKIHQKNFDKMESLIKYTERKAARMELMSPLNKTFSRMGSTKNKELTNIKESIGRKPTKKSLIPVRSSRSAAIRLKDTENMNNFIKKLPNFSIGSICEKDKNIIKGVRANKRFMLQMKMRNLVA